MIHLLGHADPTVAQGTLYMLSLGSQMSPAAILLSSLPPPCRSLSSSSSAFLFCEVKIKSYHVMHDLHAESAVAVETSGESTNRKAESNEQLLLNQIIVRISNIFPDNNRQDNTDTASLPAPTASLLSDHDHAPCMIWTAIDCLLRPCLSHPHSFLPQRDIPHPLGRDTPH
ncbi:hypothetical protein H105_03974 [Trichophyton soudanense CBS 452.61]|uniref:Uncharacterized protein n=1 Tax=Trichophyton soudanense CBS 452.61 TaxID=1215331 RepID=A0A022XU66_TRISD|nr:hypothetical protein H105_03974 [Trichophyton soudanense CBS 452.61]